MVHEVAPCGSLSLSYYVNALVITGREPVIVDAGTSDGGGQWLEDLFGLVEPADVRWIVVSHDDADHAGNLAALITACPSAVVVCNRSISDRRLGALADVPTERRRSVDAGASLDVGDRRLLLLQPPVWDAAGTLGVLDQRTGVYWGADAFACLLPGRPVETVAELDLEFWADGMAAFARHLLGPSLDLIDHRRFAATCDRTRALGMTTIASAHSPLITDASIDQAFALLRDLSRAASAVRLDCDIDVIAGHRRARHWPATSMSSASDADS